MCRLVAHCSLYTMSCWTCWLFIFTRLVFIVHELLNARNFSLLYVPGKVVDLLGNCQQRYQQLKEQLHVRQLHRPSMWQDRQPQVKKRFVCSLCFKWYSDLSKLWKTGLCRWLSQGLWCTNSVPQIQQCLTQCQRGPNKYRLELIKALAQSRAKKAGRDERIPPFAWITHLCVFLMFFCSSGADHNMGAVGQKWCAIPFTRTMPTRWHSPVVYRIRVLTRSTSQISTRFRMRMRTSWAP